MKRKLMYFLLCFVGVLTSAMSCDEPDTDVDYIMVVNGSNETITFTVYWDKEDAPLTTERYFNVINSWVSVLKPGEKTDNYFRPSLLMEGCHLQVLLIKRSTLEKYSREEIIEKNIYDKLYVLTYAELVAMDFEIVYTGEEDGAQ